MADRTLDLILGQLEKLTDNQEKLTEEIQKTNLEIAKISGIKHAVVSIKEWKEDLDKIVNADDLKKIKEFYFTHQEVNSDIEDLYIITGELRDSSDDYEKFKVRTSTVIAIVSFLFATALTLLGIYSKFHV